MLTEVTITVLVDNSVNERDLISEHGLSLLIETSGQKFLWDTGQGFALPHNAQRLGLDFKSLNGIIFSHGHYDHTGGLLGVLQQNYFCQIYLHPEAIAPKYSHHNRQNIGSPLQDPTILNQYLDRIVWIEKPTEIIPGIFCTGPVPRLHPLETTGGRFSLQPDHYREDLLKDDQALVLQVPQGLVILFGCAHSGVINTLNYIAEITQEKQFYAVIGGTHLLNASQERLEATAQTLEKYNVQLIGANHCTGFKGLNYLANHFGERFVPCPVGTRLQF